MPCLVQSHYKSGGVFFGGWDIGALTLVDDSTRAFDPTLAGGTERLHYVWYRWSVRRYQV